MVEVLGVLSFGFSLKLWDLHGYDYGYREAAHEIKRDDRKKG